jgi:hypothetical protein
VVLAEAALSGALARAARTATMSRSPEPASRVRVAGLDEAQASVGPPADQLELSL